MLHPGSEQKYIYLFQPILGIFVEQASMLIGG